MRDDLSGLIGVQTVCKSHQQTTLGDLELKSGGDKQVIFEGWPKIIIHKPKILDQKLRYQPLKMLERSFLFYFFVYVSYTASNQRICFPC